MNDFFMNFNTNNFQPTYGQSQTIKSVRDDIATDSANRNIYQNQISQNRMNLIQQKQQSSIDFTYKPSQNLQRPNRTSIGFFSSSQGYKISKK